MLLWIRDIICSVYDYKYSFINSILFRGIASLLLSFFIFLGSGHYVINRLCALRLFQVIRSNGPASHILKKETPTMGGVIILLSVALSVIVWSDLSNVYVWYMLFIFIAYGILGLVDDLLKIQKKNTVGLSVLHKYFWQSFIAVVFIVMTYVFKFNNINMICYGSFFKEIIFQLDFWNIILIYFVLVGTSNAVNLSDGLDGLAVIPVALIISGLAIIAWLSSNVHYSNDLRIVYICNAKELIIICSAVIGAGLGFLWFNTYPAQIFMGDTGALAFGGTIGLIAVLLHQEFLLLIMGGTLIIESISVILQVGYFKVFKKRIFKMAPIHHHFELQGCPEPKIVIRFWIISFLLVCISLVIFVLI